MRIITVAWFALCCAGNLLPSSAPRVQRLVSLEYPDLGIQARLQGDIYVDCTLDANGYVSSAKVVRSDGMTAQGRSILGGAAVENVKQWRFQRSTGAPQNTSAIQIVYRFRLENVSTRRRTTQCVFELPNVVYVTSQYMPATY